MSQFSAVNATTSLEDYSESQLFAKYMQAQVISNYGHIVGAIVKEFLDTVMDQVADQI